MDYKSALSKVIDEQGLVSLICDDLMDGVIKAKLDELVQKSDNSLDDAIVAMVYPIVRDEAKKFIEAQLAKMAPEPEPAA